MKSTLRNLINERCPELLELKMWCEVKHPEFETKRILEIGKNYWRDKFDWEKAIVLQDTRYQWHLSSVYGDTPEKALKWYTILWTPPSWWECLRCLGEDYAIDGEWNIWKYVKEYKAWLSHSFEDATEFPVVDLAKWPLNQSDEIIEKLVDLIPPL